MKKAKLFKISIVVALIFSLLSCMIFEGEIKAATSKVKVTQHHYKSKKFLKYPQISGLKKTINKKVNAVLSNHIKSSYKNFLHLKDIEKKNRNSKIDPPYRYETSYKVKYSTSNTLSILFYDYQYTGGAHGMGYATTYNFNITTGKQVKIKDVLKTKTNFKKVQKYAYDYLRTHEPYADFVQKLSDVNVDANSQFYYTKNGIYLVFQEYEVAPYSYGNPAIKIPSSVYKK